MQALKAAGVRKYDLSKWKYAELRDVINTSCGKTFPQPLSPLPALKGYYQHGAPSIHYATLKKPWEKQARCCALGEILDPALCTSITHAIINSTPLLIIEHLVVFSVM